MDANSIITLISNLGFPIVCCGALFWKMNKQDENHKEELEGMTKALENNTVALTKLYERLEKDN